MEDPPRAIACGGSSAFMGRGTACRPEGGGKSPAARRASPPAGNTADGKALLPGPGGPAPQRELPPAGTRQPPGRGLSAERSAGGRAAAAGNTRRPETGRWRSPADGLRTVHRHGRHRSGRPLSGPARNPAWSRYPAECFAAWGSSGPTAGKRLPDAACPGFTPSLLLSGPRPGRPCR